MSFELKAEKSHGNQKHSIVLHEAATKSQIKRFLAENLSSICNTLVINNFIATNQDVNTVEFTWVNKEKNSTKIRSIAEHPLFSGKKEQGNILWFDPTQETVLPDPEKYNVTIIGNQQYLISKNDGISYTVDLSACANFGACTCPDFSTRRSPFRSTALHIANKQMKRKHQDCVHLKWIKFLLSIPFGKTNLIPVEILQEIGHDQKSV